MSSTCAACERVGRMRRGEDEDVIAEMRESFVVLHEHQGAGGVYEGWCVVMLKGHAEHLHELESGRMGRLMEDVREVGAAVVRALGAGRVNYECLGNQLAHIHWHVVPRYGAPRDPEPREAIWVQPKAVLNAGVGAERRGELIREIRAALGVRGA